MSPLVTFVLVCGAVASIANALGVGRLARAFERLTRRVDDQGERLVELEAAVARWGA